MQNTSGTVSTTTSNSRAELKVPTGIKVGRLSMNHNERALKVRTGVEAGALNLNHNETLA
jgi:hypothetical protein